MNNLIIKDQIDQIFQLYNQIIISFYQNGAPSIGDLMKTETGDLPTHVWHLTLTNLKILEV